jgi:hypothetical protein
MMRVTAVLLAMVPAILLVLSTAGHSGNASGHSGNAAGHSGYATGHLVMLLAIQRMQLAILVTMNCWLFWLVTLLAKLTMTLLVVVITLGVMVTSCRSIVLH